MLMYQGMYMFLFSPLVNST